MLAVSGLSRANTCGKCFAKTSLRFKRFLYYQRDTCAAGVVAVETQGECFMEQTNKVLTVSILGCGSRGFRTYGRLMHQLSAKFRIVALCDTDADVLALAAKELGVEQQNCFTNDAEFFAERRSDVLVIATLDKQHYDNTMHAMALGYDILLEKPITDNKQECENLLAAQQKYGNKVVVCHVLRYAKGFVKVKELLDEGAIGTLVNIQALEQVAYWHMAHSYVRGNWRRAEDTTPMILAKCCHDLDLLQYYAASKATSVSSIGELTYFKKECAPEGSAERCMDCKYKDSCPYSAKRIYIDNYVAQGCPSDIWPQNVVVTDTPLSVDKLQHALSAGSPYGRCVFRCDNDVVSHQTTNILFDNGVTANLTMMAFTKCGGRIYKFFGTNGELVLDEEKEHILLTPFGEKTQVINLGDLTEAGMSHGGGDSMLVADLYDMITGKRSQTTGLASSIESHLMGIAAETSRLECGKNVLVH